MKCTRAFNPHGPKDTPAPSLLSPSYIICGIVIYFNHGSGLKIHFDRNYDDAVFSELYICQKKNTKLLDVLNLVINFWRYLGRRVQSCPIDSLTSAGVEVLQRGSTHDQVTLLHEVEIPMNGSYQSTPILKISAKAKGFFKSRTCN